MLHAEQKFFKKNAGDPRSRVIAIRIIPQHVSKFKFPVDKRGAPYYNTSKMNNPFLKEVIP